MSEINEKTYRSFHVKGWAKDIDLQSFFSDNYDFPERFPFEEAGEFEIKDVFLRIYWSNEERTLEEATEKYVMQMLGAMTGSGQEYGYSEYTVEGFNVFDLKLGGHDIGEIIKSKAPYYLHILIDIPL